MGVSLGLWAAAAATIDGCGFDCSDEKQKLANLLASVLDGLLLLPLAFLFVWVVHRLALSRWFLLSAVLGTAFALIGSSLIHEFIAPIFGYSDKTLEMVDLARSRYLLTPAIFVCFGGALALAWWCSRREPAEGFK